MIGEKIYIYGRHALVEALESVPHTVKKVFLASQYGDTELLKLLKRFNIPVSEIDDKLPVGSDKGSLRQGIIALLAPEKLIVSYKNFSNNLKVDSDTALVLLDEIQDPHNVGAIIRSAAAFGISGILIPEHNQAPITSTVVKVSAGMVFKVPIVSIQNVNSTLRDLKDRGFWVYGLEMNTDHEIEKEKFDTPAIFVMGNEAMGIRQKTKEICDILLSIPMNKKCESLNVAASAAVTFYAWSLQHEGALGA